jgi:hypothetical protein
MPSEISNYESSGVVVPSLGECHRRRRIQTRPLTVKTVKSCRPLFRLVLPVVASFGGGKSGFGCIYPHLQGTLEGLLSQVLEEIADLLLAARDNSLWECVFYRVGNLTAGLLKLHSHLPDDLVA